MKPMFITLACLILLALTSVEPEALVQDERSTTAEASVRAAREDPTRIAHRRRRHCPHVKGHYSWDRYDRRMYVPAHQHCHTVHSHVA